MEFHFHDERVTLTPWVENSLGLNIMKAIHAAPCRQQAAPAARLLRRRSGRCTPAACRSASQRTSRPAYCSRSRSMIEQSTRTSEGPDHRGSRAADGERVFHRLKGALQRELVARRALVRDAVTNYTAPNTSFGAHACGRPFGCLQRMRACVLGACLTGATTSTRVRCTSSTAATAILSRSPVRRRARVRRLARACAAPLCAVLPLRFEAEAVTVLRGSALRCTVAPARAGGALPPLERSVSPLSRPVCLT